jgi:isopenicillin N synthase-like dioxygenase
MLQLTLMEFTDALAERYPVGDLTKDLLAGYNECIIRLLHYPGCVHTVGEELAVQHVDKGAFTGHLYENYPGVERLTPARTWESFPVHAGQMLIFPAMRLQYRTESEVKGLCHRVVAVEGADERGRNAIVLFGNFANTPYYNKKRLGSMQGHGPGFNYDIPHEEFKRLFTAY